MKRYPALCVVLLSLILAACTSANPAATLWPTPDLRDSQTLCAELNAAWGNDWPRTIADLEKLREQNGQCDGTDPAPKLYPAYYNYGAYLDAHGDTLNANKAYQNALVINPNGIEAAQA